MNLQQLEYILAVDELKNFNKAAQRCFVSQSTLSVMIKKLEDELDVVIFDRKANPVITTDCGNEIIREARKILQQVSGLRERATNAKDRIEGTLRLGIIPTISCYSLGHFIPKLIEKYPNLEIQVKEITSELMLAELRSGLLDVGILATPLENDDFQYEVLGYEALLLYGAASGTAKFVSDNDFNGQHLWMLQEGHCFRNQTASICEVYASEMGQSPIHLDVSSFDSVIQIVDTLGGLTMIPEAYLSKMLPSQKANIRRFEAPIPVREISLVSYRWQAKWRLYQRMSVDLSEYFGQLYSTHHLRPSELLVIPSF